MNKNTRNILISVGIVFAFYLLKEKENYRGGFTNAEICIAGISKIFNQNPLNVRVASINDDLTIDVYYKRSSDGKNFDYQCKINKNRVVWRMADGRWRDGFSDSELFFKVSNENIVVQENYSDGTVDNKSYWKGQLKYNYVIPKT